MKLRSVPERPRCERMVGFAGVLWQCANDAVRYVRRNNAPFYCCGGPRHCSAAPGVVTGRVQTA